ncbi:MAG: class I SAM-dependent methyltransferase [candidate division Zixibacteria bacterium]|nr:class I SAM-dependent methyltransferase [candidate division Zixibacteria bacterium]
MDFYKDFAEEYDAMHPRETVYEQQSFFAELISRYHITSCLDCACGAGWHLEMLHRMGLDCAGSDLSPDMLALAKKHLASTGIPLKCEDFRTLERSWKGHRFDMVVCLTTSLPHVTTAKGIATALRAMRRRLNANGILVVSNGISDKLLDIKPVFIAGPTFEDRAVYFFNEYPETERAVFHVLIVSKTASGFRHVVRSMDYYAMRKDTLHGFLEQAEFRDMNYYGDFAFTRYSKRTSDRLIVVAQKPR